MPTSKGRNPAYSPGLAALSVKNPRAASVLQVILAKMDRNSALVISQMNLSRVAGCSLATLKRSLKLLRDESWIEVCQLGPTGTVCAYVVNERLLWEPEDASGIRYSLFDAKVLASNDEQDVIETHRLQVIGGE